MLYKSASFTSNRVDLKNIYLTFVRSVLEKSAVVWHSSLTRKNKTALERVQKAAVRVIMGNSLSNYQEGLEKLKIENLDTRREQLCLKFATKCLVNEKVRKMFPKKENKHQMEKRNTQKYKVNFAKTKRYKKSAIPFMAGLLNKEEKEKKQMIK